MCAAFSAESSGGRLSQTVVSSGSPAAQEVHVRQIFWPFSHCHSGFVESINGFRLTGSVCNLIVNKRLSLGDRAVSYGLWSQKRRHLARSGGAENEQTGYPALGMLGVAIWRRA